MALIKNIAKFANKILDMAKSKGKEKKKAAAKGKPSVKKAAKPTPKKAAKPAAKKATKPAAKKAAKPVAKKAVKPVAKKAAKPAPKKAAKPVAKKAAKPAPKKAAKPAAKQPVKTVLKKSAPKVKPVAAKPVKASTPVAKPVAKPVVKEVAKPAVSQQLSKPPIKTTNKPVKPEGENAQLRYSDEELKEFKELIDKKLATAREELKNLKEALDNHTESQAGNKAWNMEEGTDTTEMEYLMNQISRQHTYIRNLEMALIRIENKTYGICRQTGRLIPKERLRVVPHATLSLEAKMNRKAEEESPAATNAAPPSDFAEGFEGSE